MEQLTNIQDQLDRIETALIGDNLGNKGLVKRIVESEEKHELMGRAIVAINEKDKIVKAKLVGIAAGVGLASHGIWEAVKAMVNP